MVSFPKKISLSSVLYLTAIIDNHRLMFVVEPDNMVQEFYELLSPFTIEDLISPRACTKVYRPEGALLTVSTLCRDADLLGLFSST